MAKALFDLQPMTTGDILDRTVRIYRRHFLHAVSVVALPYLLLIPLIFAVGTLGGDAENVRDFLLNPVAGLLGLGAVVVLGVGMVALWFVSMAALTRSISEAYLGRTPSLQTAYGPILRRSGALAWAYLLSIAVMGGGLVLGMGLAIGGVVAVVQRQTAGGIALLVLLLVLGLAVLVVSVPAFYRLLFVTQVVVIEDVRGIAALRRSWKLMRGKAMQAFVISLFGGVVDLIVRAVLHFPAAILAAAFPSAAMSVLSTLLEQAAHILSVPFLTIPFTLLYYDSRIRKEAFDLEMMAANLGGPAPVAGPASGARAAWGAGPGASEPWAALAPPAAASPRLTPPAAGGEGPVIVPPPPQAPAAARGPVGRFKVCPKCGAQVPIVRPACPSCGTPVPFRPAG